MQDPTYDMVLDRGQVAAELEAALARWTRDLAGARHDARQLPTTMERDCARDVMRETRWAISQAQGMLRRARAVGVA
jgi:hypothetical protein